MSDTNPKVERQLESELFDRAFRARLGLIQMSGPKLLNEYRQRLAECLCSVGLTVIPSDHLRDHEFVVSREVYEAAKRMQR